MQVLLEKEADLKARDEVLLPILLLLLPRGLMGLLMMILVMR